MILMLMVLFKTLDGKTLNKFIRLLGKREKCERGSEYFTAIICEKILFLLNFYFKFNRGKCALTSPAQVPCIN